MRSQKNEVSWNLVFLVNQGECMGRAILSLKIFLSMEQVELFFTLLSFIQGRRGRVIELLLSQGLDMCR